MEFIQSKDNKTIKHIIALGQRKNRQKSGEYIVEGIRYIRDIAKYDSSVLRHLMGYVFQQAYLFKGSIKDNLTLFDTSISYDDMVDAAKQVNLDSMIEQLPEGYHTPVGYLGSLLSDGQKQLLAFGRTLIRKTPILLLDEATANIDSHTEKQIQASIENIRGSKTIVSIAHRLSTVQDANKIVYVEYGKIIEKGSTVPFIKNIPFTPAATAVRIMVPRLPGS
jgi:ATP-binding cassette, subfamily B, multidrug efflux pump